MILGKMNQEYMIRENQVWIMKEMQTLMKNIENLDDLNKSQEVKFICQKYDQKEKPCE